jgi:hypothetical protein
MKSRESVPTRRRGASSYSGLAVVVIVVAGVALMVMRAGAPRDADTGNLSVDRIAASDTTRRAAPTVEETVGAFRVRDATGAIVPLVTEGEPAILMISSVTCGWCKKSLKDLGELSAGRPLPRLKLLTLEGAAGGAPMLARENITGAQLIGPSGSRDQVLLTFRYPGTPTFVAIDKTGRVVATIPGYPMREVLKTWHAVMVGDADVP